LYFRIWHSLCFFYRFMTVPPLKIYDCVFLKSLTITFSQSFHNFMQGIFVYFLQLLEKIFFDFFTISHKAIFLSQPRWEMVKNSAAVLSAALFHINWGILCWILYRHAMYCSCTLACTVPWPIATAECLTLRPDLTDNYFTQRKYKDMTFTKYYENCDVGHIPSSLQAMRCGTYSLKSPSDAMWGIFPQISKHKKLNLFKWVKEVTQKFEASKYFISKLYKYQIG